MKRICGRILFDDGNNWAKGRHTVYALGFIVEVGALWPEQLGKSHFGVPSSSFIYKYYIILAIIY